MPDPSATPSPASHGFHLSNDLATIARSGIARPQPASAADGSASDAFPTTEFRNFCHPLVGELIQQLNQGSIASMLDPCFLERIASDFFAADYSNILAVTGGPSHALIATPYPRNDIDLSLGGPYANYNWELLYHLPVAVAEHLTKNQRFAEAQRWLELVFDPKSRDMTVPEPQRYWKFLGFRPGSGPPDPGSINFADIGALLVLLSTPEQSGTPAYLQQQSVLNSYNASTTHPFMPHLIARTRQISYQYYVVMRYLDNLIAWGDSLFAQFTVETINEATLCYVLAANLLGPRPEQVPAPGTASAMNYFQLRGKLDAMGNALVELEAQFPFNLAAAAVPGQAAGPLFGLGQTLYFCVPPNQTLLGYWDTVADRLFKIRHCQNLQGIVQPLPLFDTPLSPALLVSAAAAGIDVGSIVSGLTQPVGPVRSITRIQKALELCGEVRSLGNALLAAFEKGDAEELAQLRQNHESTLQQMTQNARYLQWQQSQQATESLVATRATTLERYTYYLRLLGQVPDATAPGTLVIDHGQELTEDNFNDLFNTLVAAYDQAVTLQKYPTLTLAGSSSPAVQSGAAGQGNLYLNTSEDTELNNYLPAARDHQLAASVAEALAPALLLIPGFTVDLQYWGIGASILLSGAGLAEDAKVAAEILRMVSQYEQAQGGIAGKTGGYQRRADEWVMQANVAARELTQIGRQILSSLIAEQVADHEYKITQAQLSQAQDVLTFLTGGTVTLDDGTAFSKLTTADLYGWMQGELSRLYYQYYGAALDAARKAEQTMKWELMRPELDATTFIQPNYWNSGRQGLLSGEALYLDLKRLETAYLDSNKRELELTSNISLRQLDPYALLSLKATGSCTVTIPEAYYDRACAGHYLWRIKNVSLSIPSVVGPYTSVNCALSQQSSTVRVSSQLNGGASDPYARDPSTQDARFTDYYGSVDSVVTSTATNDGGMFETNLRDDRFLPFEGGGAISTWNLTLPGEFRAFDYATISDVILHVRYTARDGGQDLAQAATRSLKTLLDTANQSGLALLFSLRYDFPTEWAAYATGSGSFTCTLRKDYFPFMVVGPSLTLTIDGLVLFTRAGQNLVPETVTSVDLTSLAAGLNGLNASAALTLATLPAGDPGADIYLIVQYHAG